MRSIASKFKDRIERYKDVVTRPISPTGDDLKDLDSHVEKLHATKIMKMDDFSQVLFIVFHFNLNYTSRLWEAGAVSVQTSFKSFLDM